MIFKNYRKLYKIELNNRKLLEERKRELSEANIDLQKEIQLLRKDRTEVILELENTCNFLQQEKECSEALRRERTKLRRQITNLKKELNK